jgi:hypothetical protein
MDNKCYICLENTEFKSPCKCQLYLCKECFKKLLKHKNEQCSICKSNYESVKILLSRNIELKRRNSPSSTKSLIIDISEIHLTESEESIEEVKNISKYKKIRQFIFCIFFLILIMIFGNIIYSGMNINKWIIDFYIVAMGLLLILIITLILELIYCIFVIAYYTYTDTDIRLNV